MTSASVAIIDQINDMMAQGRANEAAAALARAADQGDAEALYLSGLWHVFGDIYPRDFGAARSFFGRAGAVGHRQALRTYAVFIAIGAGGAADWPKAVAILRDVSKNDPVAARQIALIDRMDIDDNARPRAVQHIQVVSPGAPRLAVAPKLFSEDECQHVRDLALGYLAPSVIVNPHSGVQETHPIRTSDGAVLGPIQQDLVIHALNNRIAAITGTNEAQGEPLSILRYSRNQQYRLHHDCLPGESNQRRLTVIVYLSQGFTGGSTYFPAIDRQLKGDIGDAILFSNITMDGAVDETSRHAGLPVERGEKWICTRWIRTSNFDPWGMRVA